MTWAEWCDSTYNTGGFGIYGPHNTNISASENPDYYIFLNSTYMTFDDAIVEGAAYTTQYMSYGVGGSN